MEKVTLAIMLLGLLALTLTTVYTSILGFQVRRAGIGRIIFNSLVSLKFWSAGVLSYWLLISAFPDVLHDSNRLVIRSIFGVYLLLQTSGVLIALERWRKKPLL